MPRDFPGLLRSEPEAAVLDRLAVVERGCLALVEATVAVNVVEWLVPAFSRAFAGSWRPLSLDVALAAVLSTLSLQLTRFHFSKRMRAVGAMLAALVALGCAAAFAGHLIRVFAGIDAQFPEGSGHWLHLPARMSMESAGGLALLAVTILFLRARKRAAVLAGDFLVFCLTLVVLILISGQIMGSMAIFGPVTPLNSAPQTLFCLLLLSIAALVRQMPKGVFSILLGRGIGSRIARGLVPVLLVLPYFREGMRARLISVRHMPPHSITAILASLAAVISVVVVLYVAWRINALEAEVHDLSLRDPLTGLYNLRGFRLLAQQALLLARRSGQPFSMLFVDVDDLKQTNDLLGHQTGSDFLVETSEILREACRETDVLGRIGGDEFAVAGQFSAPAIARAAERLQRSAAERNAASDWSVPLSFSVGYITSESPRHDSLDALLAQADEAMYQEKRRRKAVLQ